MSGRSAVVVGGGLVAARRAELLVRSGASVTVFASDLSDEFFDLSGKPNFRHVPRDPGVDDFVGSTLCFIATEDERLTRAALNAARSARTLVNVADRPELSDFIMPSIVDRSPLVIAISTGGASPILGRMLRARLESLIPAAYGRLADLMGGFRSRVAAAIPSQAPRRRFWETVLEGPIAEAALAGNESAARERSRAALEIFLSAGFDQPPFDLDDAREAGEIRAELEAQGTPIGWHDTLIAAQARRRGATLVTSNTREFGRVPGLLVVDWASGR